MNEHKILEEAFKEEFGDNWQVEMRDFEHGFSSFYDASINAIRRALVLSNVVATEGKLCGSFETDSRTSSATICKHCGRDKFMHPHN